LMPSIITNNDDEAAQEKQASGHAADKSLPIQDNFLSLFSFFFSSSDRSS
jgi:hypothetical protein